MRKIFCLILALCMLAPLALADDSVWECPVCHIMRDTNFCPVCRSARPASVSASKYPVFFSFGMLGDEPVLVQGNAKYADKVVWQLTDADGNVIAWPYANRTLNEQSDLMLEEGLYTLTYIDSTEERVTGGYNWKENFRLNFTVWVYAGENVCTPDPVNDDAPDLLVYRQLMNACGMDPDRAVFLRADNGQWMLFYDQEEVTDCEQAELAVALLERAGAFNTLELSIDDGTLGGMYIVSVIPDMTGWVLPDKVEFTGIPKAEYVEKPSIQLTESLRMGQILTVETNAPAVTFVGHMNSSSFTKWRETDAYRLSEVCETTLIVPVGNGSYTKPSATAVPAPTAKPSAPTATPATHATNEPYVTHAPNITTNPTATPATHATNEPYVTHAPNITTNPTPNPVLRPR